jgi:hypothetical protein
VKGKRTRRDARDFDGGRRDREIEEAVGLYTVVAGFEVFFFWLSRGRACACESVQHRFGPSCSVILVAVRKPLICFNSWSKKISPCIINHPKQTVLVQSPFS